MGSEFLQEFQFGAEQSGIKADQAAMGMQRFARRLAQAQQGGGELLPTLQQMGIELTDAAGNAKSTEEVLKEFADGMTQIEDPQARLLAAFKAFDSEGAALINVMKGGAAGLEEFAQQAHASGAIYEQEVVDRLADADSKLVLFGRVLRVDFAEALVKVLPFLINVRGGIMLMADAAGVAFGVMKKIGQEFIRNPFGLTPSRMGEILNVAGQRLALRGNRRLQEREDLLRGFGNRNAPGVGGAANAAAGANGSAAKQTVDQLARMGGFRGGNSGMRRQLELLQRQQGLTQQQLRELERIARNTDLLQ